MRSAALVLILAFLVSGQSALAGASHPVRLRWKDAGQMIAGKRVRVTTTDGANYKGRVRAVEPDAIVFESGKTPRITRSNVAEIRLTEYAGNGRYIGRLAGGTMGLLFGIVGAVAIGMKEDTSHNDRNKVLAGISGLGGLPGGMAAGYFIGRLADKK